MAQYGLKEVMNFTLAKFHPNAFKREPILSVDYAQITEIENGGDRIPVEGGQGYQQLMNFDHSKTTAVNITLPLIDLDMLALISGDDLATRIKKTFKREVFPASAVGATSDVTLTKTPLEGSLYVYEVGGYRDLETQLTPAASPPAVAENEYSIDGKVISLNKDQFDDCKEIVVYYHFKTTDEVKNLKIDPTKFPKAVSFYGDTFMRDQFDEEDKLFHVAGHKGRIRPEYTLTMGGTDVAVLEITLDMYAIKDRCTGEQMYLEYIEDEDNDYDYQEGNHV